MPRLLAREEEAHGGPGRALDLGCGSGAHTVTLAERGWKATGADLIPKALGRARRRIAERGVTADVVHADVTELPAEVVGTGYDFVLDVGCFHGLTAAQRRAMGTAVTAIAAPDASMLLLAFKAGGVPRPLPRGADRPDIEVAFPAWVVTDVEPATTARDAQAAAQGRADLVSTAPAHLTSRRALGRHLQPQAPGIAGPLTHIGPSSCAQDTLGSRRRLLRRNRRSRGSARSRLVIARASWRALVRT